MKLRIVLLAVVAGMVAGSASFALAQADGGSINGVEMVVPPGYGVSQAADCPEATGLIQGADLSVDNYTTPGGGCPDIDELEQALQEVAEARSDDSDGVGR